MATFKDLFNLLYNAQTERELDKFVLKNPNLFKEENWFPLGRTLSNYSIVKNQQANPIAALIEKLTNSIDAILTKKCMEAGIEPTSKDAPGSIEEAVNIFFKEEHKTWDMLEFRKSQAKEIQVIADGPARETSVIIYDNGEGQHPEKFEDTFLSLIKRNKANIHFVQGKYNMGGSGAIVFCGKKSYQLIASKKYDGTGKFGFTLVREHPLTEEEIQQRDARETWYEYLKINNEIPSFEIDELNLGLFERKFKTGSILKLYSYQFPPGYSGFAQELNQSINEYLFEPALPIYTVDKKERYPNNKVLELDLYGLKRRLEKTDNDYVYDHFFWKFSNDDLFGKMKVTAYVFKSRLKNRDSKKSKKIIRDRFFKNDMAILFSINGQVHGHFTAEFITRSLQLSLLKSHLLVHVDCTNMLYNFRKELFMASRDRLKNGNETKQLRHFLAKELSKKDGPLAEIEKHRKEALSYDGEDTKELLKSFAKNLPMNPELMKLLNQTFKLDLKDLQKKKPQRDENTKPKPKEKRQKFKPERFPTYFNLKSAENDGTKAISIPRGSDKTILFDTDVENHYFDRIEEPGDLQIALVTYKSNDVKGGTDKGKPSKIEEVFHITRSNPKDGKIRVSLYPKTQVKVGDEIELKVDLSAPGGNLEELFWTRISENSAKPEKKKKEELIEPPLGLPEPVLVFKESKNEKDMTWEKLDENSLSMNWETVMIPLAKGHDQLERVFINMDSRVYKSFLSNYRNPNEEQIKVAERKYISSVYFHTLFLYTITKNRGYEVYQKQQDKSDLEPIDVGEYLKDIFDNYYSTFILNFGGTNELMMGVGE